MKNKDLKLHRFPDMLKNFSRPSDDQEKKKKFNSTALSRERRSTHLVAPLAVAAKQREVVAGGVSVRGVVIQTLGVNPAAPHLQEGKQRTGNTEAEQNSSLICDTLKKTTKKNEQKYLWTLGGRHSQLRASPAGPRERAGRGKCSSGTSRSSCTSASASAGGAL